MDRENHVLVVEEVEMVAGLTIKAMVEMAEEEAHLIRNHLTPLLHLAEEDHHHVAEDAKSHSKISYL